MSCSRRALSRLSVLPALLAALFLGSGAAHWLSVAEAQSPAALLAKDQFVDWWFVFKLNATFPDCGGSSRSCPFGGIVQKYRSKVGQQYVFASSANSRLQRGTGCAGETPNDPIGATFGQIYEGNFHFIVWNDQFYDDPKISGCTGSCGGPWGHSKGILAWNDDGTGVVVQVTTPSWPGSGTKDNPRKVGNTLGCVSTNNNVLVSQHFFALKLSESDVVAVLKGLHNASVVTNPRDPQIAKLGGPKEIRDLAASLGEKSTSTTYSRETLSTRVEVISKPSKLNVPPWQMVSAVLGVSLRTATWWASPYIPTTTANRKITCWDDSLGKPGRVEVATTGQWDGKEIGLKGSPGPNGNHAKIAVSISGDRPYAIFGDLNQQGTLSDKNCARSQNGRGGLFFVVEDPVLAQSVADLIDGETASTRIPATPKPAAKPAVKN